MKAKIIEKGHYLTLEIQEGTSPPHLIVLRRHYNIDKIKAQVEKDVKTFFPGTTKERREKRRKALKAAYEAISNYFISKAEEQEAQHESAQAVEMLPKKEGALRDVITFSWIIPLYSKPKLSLDEEGELRGIKTEWRLYAGYLERAQPPIIIYDPDGFVNPKRLEYSLQKLDEETLALLEAAAPQQHFFEIGKKHNLSLSQGDSSIRLLWQAGLLTRPVPRLKDVNFLKSKDWRKYVDNLVNFKGITIDPRLLAVRKTHLMRGLKQSVNPHTIISLPGQTAKSEWYNYIGILEDKVKPNSLIGYADADGPKPGSVDGAELPFAIDQIEAGAYQIFKFLLGLMESGRARVDTAAMPFVVKCTSPFIIISNPIGDPRNDFSVLIEKMSRNPALGRRFGIILYDDEAVRVKKREKELEKLREEINLFRAVEEYVWPDLKKIIVQDKVWDWLNTENEEYVKQAKEAILSIENNGASEDHLIRFLLEFAENGQPHTRGAALRSALTYNLDLIALKNYEIKALLSEAEEYLADLLEINFKSICRIAESFEEAQEAAALRLFDRLPTYMKEIISAIELWRRTLPPEEKEALKQKVPIQFYLNTLDYKPRTTDYFSEILKQAKRGNPERYNDELRKLLGFELKKDTKGIMAVITSPQPIQKIEPLGEALDNLDILDKVPGEASEKRIDVFNEEAKQPTDNQPTDNQPEDMQEAPLKNTLSKNSNLPPNNIQNVQNVQEQRCADCRFFKGMKCQKHPEWITVTPDHSACELFKAKKEDE